VTLNLDFKVTV